MPDQTEQKNRQEYAARIFSKELRQGGCREESGIYDRFLARFIA